MFQQLEVLGPSPDQPLVDLVSLDSGLESRAAQKPQTVLHAIESRIIPGQVLAIDGRFGLEHQIDHLDQSRQVFPTLCFRELIMEPVPRQDGMDPACGIPVHGFALPVAGLVEIQACRQALLRLSE